LKGVNVIAIASLIYRQVNVSLAPMKWLSHASLHMSIWGTLFLDGISLIV